jgi:Integrase zinc binding domain
LFAIVGVSMNNASTCPFAYDVLEKAQTKEFPTAQRQAWPVKTLGQYSLCVDHSGRIYVPPSLQKPILHWYHDNLRHPGQAHLARTLQMHYVWPSLSADIIALTHVCDVCQRWKKQ